MSDCPTLTGEKWSKIAFVFTFSTIIFFFLHQSAYRFILSSESREYSSLNANVLLNRENEEELYEDGNDRPLKMTDLKKVNNLTLFNPTLELAKKMTTEQLGQLVLTNCRLTNHMQDETSQNKYEAAIKTTAKVRASKNYKWSPVSSHGKTLAYCLNTKSGSTYLKQNIIRSGNRKLYLTATNDNLVNAFMVIREPMHRLLSAYLQKLRECQDYQRICPLWKSFAENIAQYVKNVKKKESNLFDANLEEVEAYEVSFTDFVDYIIHMYLRNDGAVMDPIPDFDTPIWTWWHWQSVVQDRCFSCSAVWKDVVLFENLAEHLQQVMPKYPELFRNPERLPEIKSSETSTKVMQYFQEISDPQLWFLGNVMYAVDYAILPYDFDDFCKSINRLNVTKASISSQIKP